MSVEKEIREQQKQALNAMSIRERLSYFWYYYKVQTIAAILVTAFIISFIRQFTTNRPYAFYAVLLNASNTVENVGTDLVWADEFLAYAGIDPDAYQVNIDTTMVLSSESGSQYETANRQKMAAMMQLGDIHAILADTETFENYARLEFFYDLASIFTAEELAPYKDLFYYTDAAAFDEDAGSTLEEMEAATQAVYAQVIDHRNPSDMEKPVVVGIRIPDKGNKLADSGYYSYLTETETIFQGYPAETVIGIPLSVKNPHLALQFLAYLMES